MSKFRHQNSINLVTPHLKGEHTFTRSVKILGDGHQVASSEDEGQAVGRAGGITVRHVAGKTGRAVAGAASRSFVGKAGKAATNAGRRPGGLRLQSKTFTRTTDVHGNTVWKASERRLFHRTRTTTFYPSGRPGSSRLAGQMMPGKSKLATRRQATRLKRAGRAQARGTRRAGQMAVRVIQVAWAKMTGAIVAATSVVAGTSFGLAAALVGLVIVIMSFIPTVIMNLIIDDEVSPVAFVVGDDYPWAYLVRNGDGSPSDVYNTINEDTRFYYGNCTDFVFWRVNRDMGGYPGAWVYSYADLTPNGGNGREWGKEGNMPSWETVTDPAKARPGDVVSFEAGTLGHTSEFGHVAYVAAVDGEGNITTENYGVAQYYVETIAAADAKAQIEAGNLVIKHNPALQARIEAGVGGGNDVVTWALSQQGMPYGRGKGMGSTDCCWLVHNAFKNGRGISLPMSYRGQPWATAKCEYAMYALASTYGGYYVPLSMAQPGDIVFMQDAGTSKAYDNLTHVAIYAGNGQIIDAASMGVGVRPLYYYGSSQRIEPLVVRVD